MKIFFYSLILLSGVTLCNAQKGNRIAYIDMDYILGKLNYYQDASKLLDKKASVWKKELQEKQSKIEQLRKNLSYEKILLTKELIEEREEEIFFYEKELGDYQKKRFGPRGDYEIQQANLVKPVQDLIFNAVQKIAKKKRYDIVFDRSTTTMIYSNKIIDISNQVLLIIKRKKSNLPKINTSK